MPNVLELRVQVKRAVRAVHGGCAGLDREAQGSPPARAGSCNLGAAPARRLLLLCRTGPGCCGAQGAAAARHPPPLWLARIDFRQRSSLAGPSYSASAHPRTASPHSNQVNLHSEASIRAWAASTWLVYYCLWPITTSRCMTSGTWLWCAWPKHVSCKMKG